MRLLLLFALTFFLTPAFAASPQTVCIEQSLRQVREARSFIEDPGATWASLRERSVGHFDKNDAKTYLGFSAPEAAGAVEFAKSTALEFRAEIKRRFQGADLSEFDSIATRADRLKSEDYPYLKTLSLLNDYAALASRVTESRALGKAEFRGIGNVEYSGQDKIFMQAVSSVLSGFVGSPEEFRFVLPTERDLSFRDFIKASPFPVHYVGVLKSIQNFDQVTSGPFGFWLHDWGHFAIVQGVQKKIIAQEGLQTYLAHIPGWRKNVDAMLAEHDSLRAGPLKSHTEILAFELTHEEGYPPSAQYWISKKESVRATLKDKLKKGFFGPAENLNGITDAQFDRAWTWLVKRLP